MSFTTVPDKAAGDVFTEAMWDTYLRDNINIGVMRMLADLTLSGSQASIDFASIPATFAHLRLVCYLRGDGVGASDNLILRFNADSGANYDTEIFWAAATAFLSPVESLAGTGAISARIPNAASTAGFLGLACIDIAHYANAVSRKIATAEWSAKYADATGKLETGQTAIGWRSTAAINRITLLPNGGSNFVSGSRVTLYGLPQ